jgi:hypothetical protein
MIKKWNEGKHRSKLGNVLLSGATPRGLEKHMRHDFPSEGCRLSSKEADPIWKRSQLENRPIQPRPSSPSTQRKEISIPNAALPESRHSETDIVAQNPSMLSSALITTPFDCNISEADLIGVGDADSAFKGSGDALAESCVQQDTEGRQDLQQPLNGFEGGTSTLSSVPGLLREALKRYDSGNFEMAEKCCREALNINSHISDALHSLHCLGFIHLIDNKLSEARIEF